MENLQTYEFLGITLDANEWGFVVASALWLAIAAGIGFPAWRDRDLPKPH